MIQKRKKQHIQNSKWKKIKKMATNKKEKEKRPTYNKKGHKPLASPKQKTKKRAAHLLKKKEQPNPKLHTRAVHTKAANKCNGQFGRLRLDYDF
jgi:hypothetical protein